MESFEEHDLSWQNSRRYSFSEQKQSPDNQPNEVGKPSMYEVYLINDDAGTAILKTILKDFFNKNESEASRLIEHDNPCDKVLCEIYTRELAETKVSEVNDYTFEQNYSLKCIMQKSRKHVIKKS